MAYKDLEDAKKYQKEYYQKNKEIIKVRHRKWVQNNPEKAKEYVCKYRRTYSIQLLNKQRKWGAEHREEKNTYSRQWRKNNPEKQKSYDKKYGERNIAKKRERSKKWRDANPLKVKVRTEKYRKENPWLGNYCAAHTRCTNPNSQDYRRYGGRGIKLLMNTRDFKHLWFRDNANMMDKPSIDRIDSNGNYELNNCRFIEHSENSRRVHQ